MEIESFSYNITGFAILDNDGDRLLAKYFNAPFTNVKEEVAFEKSLFRKTHKANAEIILHEGLISVYRSNVDLFFYVMGRPDDNELILVNVLNCLYDSVSLILRKQVEKRVLLEHLHAVLLAADEITDQGVVMETDPALVCERVLMQQDEGYAQAMTEQSVGQLGYSMFKSAKEQIQWSLLK